MQTLKLNESDYETYFKKFKQCIEAFNFSYTPEHEDIVVSFRLNDTALKIKLHPCIEDPKTRLTQLMFELVHIISRKNTSSNCLMILLTLKATVDTSSYTATVPTASSPKKPLASMHSAVSNTAIVKRKVGHSLLNPNTKRYVII
jgi:hypothetical protein